MDLKLKVILMLFVLLAVGYAIYFVFKDLSKKKQADREDQRITEKYEDYDIRKQILNQLDTYKIDKKTKTTIYDTLSSSIEKFKEMPESKINEMIKEVVDKAKGTARSVSEKITGKKGENFEDNDDDYDREDFREREAPAPALSEAKEIKKMIDATASQIEEVAPAHAPLQAATPAFSGAKDITNMIDAATSQIGSVERSLSQIKTMVSAMAETCTPVNASNAISPKTPEKAKEDSKLLTTTIEGFENFSGRGYSYL